MAKIMRSVPDVIEALGGENKAAEKIGVVTGALRNWRGREGYIPATYFLLVQHLLKRHGSRADMSVFNFVPVPKRGGTGASPRQADRSGAPLQVAT